MPPIADALPSGKASEYVVAAYLVFLLLLVVYLTIMAVKVQRIEKDLRELAGFAEQRNQEVAEEEAQHAEVGGG